MLMQLFHKWKSEKCPRCGGNLEFVSSDNGRETKRCAACGEHNYQEVSTFGEESGGSMTNKALYGQAAALVDEYNKAAGALADTVGKLWELRKKLNDGNGNIIISGDKWNNNALSCIPMLRMEGGNFPTISPAGKFYQAGVADPVFFAIDSFSEVDQQKKQINPNQEGKSMNRRLEKSFMLAAPTGSNSKIVYEGIWQMLSNCFDTIDTINANTELTTDAKNKRLQNLYSEAFSSIEGYYTMVNACLTQAKSITQSTINVNSQNMGKDGDTNRQAATWRALETKKLHEIGASCKWSPEFMGALIAAPPGVLNWDDLDKEFIVSKIQDKLPESYHTSVSEAKDINNNVAAALITLSAEAKRPYTYRKWREPDMVREILFP